MKPKNTTSSEKTLGVAILCGALVGFIAKLWALVYRQAQITSFNSFSFATKARPESLLKTRRQLRALAVRRLLIFSIEENNLRIQEMFVFAVVTQQMARERPQRNHWRLIKPKHVEVIKCQRCLPVYSKEGTRIVTERRSEQRLRESAHIGPATSQ